MIQSQLPKFDGTDSWTASVIGVDVVQDYLEEAGQKSGAAYDFQFFTQTDILVQINGSGTILIPEGTKITYAGIWSFKLMSDGDVYSFIAQYA